MIAALLMFLAQPSSPAEDVAKEVGKAVEAGLEAHPGAEPEIDCGNAESQLEMNACSFRDFEATDAVLNEQWRLASDRAKAGDRWSAEHDFRGGEFDRLLEAQRKWLEFRDAQCLSEVGPRESGGSIWPFLHNGCLRLLTEARIAQLRHYNEPQN